jgi:hypothetical protein
VQSSTSAGYGIATLFIGLILMLIATGVTGAICYFIAKSKGLNAQNWAIIGGVVGFLGSCICYIPSIIVIIVAAVQTAKPAISGYPGYPPQYPGQPGYPGQPPAPGQYPGYPQAPGQYPGYPQAPQYPPQDPNQPQPPQSPGGPGTPGAS